MTKSRVSNSISDVYNFENELGHRHHRMLESFDALPYYNTASELGDWEEHRIIRVSKTHGYATSTTTTTTTTATTTLAPTTTLPPTTTTTTSTTTLAPTTSLPPTTTTTTTTTLPPTTTTTETTTSIGSGYGALYNWYAASYNNGGETIAPSGWHVPTIGEWITLEVAVANGDGDVAGGRMKETGFTRWDSPNTDATNSSGMTLSGAGNRLGDGSFWGVNQINSLWASSAYDTSNAYLMEVYYDYEGSSTVNYYDKKQGNSIRLIKDDMYDPYTMSDWDGNIYPTVKIGNQVWMAENLKTKHYGGGTPIPEVTDNTNWSNLTTGAVCAYNNNWGNA